MDKDSLLFIINALNNKIDKVIESQKETNEILVRNTATLEVHVKRTDLAEEKIELIRQEVENIESKTDKNESFLSGVVWVISGLAGLLALLYETGIL